jgi:hypothetical protein
MAVRRAAAGVFGLAASILIASTAVAYTVIGASFSPDHGSRGAMVVVTGLPLAADCPDVLVELAAADMDPSRPIDSAADPRLIQLEGVVTHPPIGAGGIGDTRPGTAFTFRVPPIDAGTYDTFWQCSGGSPAFGALTAGDSSFSVDPPAPDTDVAQVEAPRPVEPPILPLEIFAALGGLAFVRRVTGRRREPGA